MSVDGRPVHAFLDLGTFSDRIVVPESAAIAMPHQVSGHIAALIGCAVSTGVGAVLNTARVRPGQSAVVIGCGGVGQSILLGLALARQSWSECQPRACGPGSIHSTSLTRARRSSAATTEAQSPQSNSLKSPSYTWQAICRWMHSSDRLGHSAKSMPRSQICAPPPGCAPFWIQPDKRKAAT